MGEKVFRTKFFYLPHNRGPIHHRDMLQALGFSRPTMHQKSGRGCRPIGLAAVQSAHTFSKGFGSPATAKDIGNDNR